jgi:hypothetical protein
MRGGARSLPCPAAHGCGPHPPLLWPPASPPPLALRRLQQGLPCHTNRRHDVLELLTGAVLPVWQRLDSLHRANSLWGAEYHKKRVTRSDGTSYYEDTTDKKPLGIVKVITSEGLPVVGVAALCAAQMEFLCEHIAPPTTPEEVAADYLTARHGTVYHAGAGAGAGARGRQGRPGGGDGGGDAAAGPSKKPKHFR